MKAWIVGLVALALFAVARGAEADPPSLWATLPEPPALPRPDRSGFVASHGARLYYAVFHPDGRRPVVLLHGGLASSGSWGFEVPKLLKTHEVIVIDSRGHGRSTRGDEPLSYGVMAADVLAVMDRLRVPRASIVGASDGAIIGLLLAIDHPARIDKLFAWGANFNTHSEPSSPPDPAFRVVGAAYIARMQSQYRALSPTPQDFAGLRAALGQMYATQPNLTPADLARIRSRTVIADGEHEQFITPEHTALLAHSIPGAKLVVLPNVSHGGPLQDPAAFHKAVAALLD